MQRPSSFLETSAYLQFPDTICVYPNNRPNQSLGSNIRQGVTSMCQGALGGPSYFSRVKHPQDVLSSLSLSLRASLCCPPIRDDEERATTG